MIDMTSPLVHNALLKSCTPRRIAPLLTGLHHLPAVSHHHLHHHLQALRVSVNVVATAMFLALLSWLRPYELRHMWKEAVKWCSLIVVIVASVCNCVTYFVYDLSVTSQAATTLRALAAGASTRYTTAASGTVATHTPFCRNIYDIIVCPSDVSPTLMHAEPHAVNSLSLLLSERACIIVGYESLGVLFPSLRRRHSRSWGICERDAIHGIDDTSCRDRLVVACVPAVLPLVRRAHRCLHRVAVAVQARRPVRGP